jgi:uncharacterized membrane protein
MKPTGVICVVCGFAIMIVGAVFFFGHETFARHFLGAKFLFGSPLTNDDEDKVFLMLLLGVVAGFFGFVCVVVGSIFLAIGVGHKVPIARYSTAMAVPPMRREAQTH